MSELLTCDIKKILQRYFVLENENIRDLLIDVAQHMIIKISMHNNIKILDGKLVDQVAKLVWNNYSLNLKSISEHISSPICSDVAFLSFHPNKRIRSKLSSKKFIFEFEMSLKDLRHLWAYFRMNHPTGIIHPYEGEVPTIDETIINKFKDVYEKLVDLFVEIYEKSHSLTAFEMGKNILFICKNGTETILVEDVDKNCISGNNILIHQFAYE